MNTLEVQIPKKDFFDTFIEWVERTNLFRLIKDNPNADRIEGLNNGEIFSLQQFKGRKIVNAIDLPFPILLHFLKNYHEVPDKVDLGSKDTTKMKILKIIMEDGATIEDFIDVVIEGNAIIGVGLISLGERLEQYCLSKIK